MSFNLSNWMPYIDWKMFQLPARPNSSVLHLLTCNCDAWYLGQRLRGCHNASLNTTQHVSRRWRQLIAQYVSTLYRVTTELTAVRTSNQYFSNLRYSKGVHRKLLAIVDVLATKCWNQSCRCKCSWYWVTFMCVCFCVHTYALSKTYLFFTAWVWWEFFKKWIHPQFVFLGENRIVISDDDIGHFSDWRLLNVCYS